MGTDVHPIEAFSSGSPPSDGHTTQVISGGTTEVISVTDSSTTTDEEYTYVPVTSTPVKKNAPAFLDKNGTGDSSNLPSTIFGSPETTSNKMPGHGGESSSDISDLNWTTFWIKIWKQSNPTTILHKICTRAEKDNFLIQC